MMKKGLIILLALTFLVSMTGMSFAQDSSWFSKWKSGSSIKGDIKKDIKIKNEAEAKSGDACAQANTSANKVVSRSEATADEDGNADNDVKRTVTNEGDALAYSEKADALNDVTNNDCETIKETADTDTNVDITVDADISGGFLVGDAAAVNSVNGSGDPSASVGGDVCVDIEMKNEVEAKTGDATAVGNVATTEVCAEDEAFAGDDGNADNDSEICVTNKGEAVAYSETAVATNEAQNLVTIDIIRSSCARKAIDIFADVSVDNLFPL